MENQTAGCISVWYCWQTLQDSGLKTAGGWRKEKATVFLQRLAKKMKMCETMC